jgi:hypothetical protein
MDDQMNKSKLLATLQAKRAEWDGDVYEHHGQHIPSLKNWLASRQE